MFYEDLKGKKVLVTGSITGEYIAVNGGLYMRA
jgi:hypothetical protein